MNEVFFSLSAALLAFAGWFSLGFKAAYAFIAWLLMTLFIFGGLRLTKKVLMKLESSSRGRRLQQSQQSTLLFTPIENPIAASLAAQITPKMTLSQIDSLVGRSHHTARPIHAISAPISN